MTLQATSLLLVCLSFPPSVPGPSVTPVRKEANSMWNLAALGVRSSSRQQSEQLSLFDSLVVLPEVVEQDIQAPADQSGSAVAVVGQVSNLLQLVNVRLSQSQCDFLNNTFHGRAPEDMSSVRPVDTQQTCEISASGTGTITGKQGAHFEVPSKVPPQSEGYLNDTLPKSFGSPEDHIPQVSGSVVSPVLPRTALDWILGPKGSDLSERVLARLVQAEAHEPNNSLRSDYRQAFICVSLASKGNQQAFLESSYAVHGIHQDKVWPRVVANRKERLGREYYQFFTSNDLPRPDVKWDERIVYDLPSSAAPSSPHTLPADKTGDGKTSSSGLRPSPVHPIHEKERLA